MTPAHVGSVEEDRIWERNKEHKWTQNRDYPEMQILYIWGLTYAQETKGHPAEEPGGHGRVGQEKPSPR